MNCATINTVLKHINSWFQQKWACHLILWTLENIFWLVSGLFWIETHGTVLVKDHHSICVEGFTKPKSLLHYICIFDILSTYSLVAYNCTEHQTHFKMAGHLPYQKIVSKRSSYWQTFLSRSRSDRFGRQVLHLLKANLEGFYVPRGFSCVLYRAWTTLYFLLWVFHEWPSIFS